MVICLNHNPMFQAVWKAIKVFLHKNTVAKMKLVRTKSKYLPVFQEYFSEELSSWLSEEINMNKQSPMPVSQMTFWQKPTLPSEHDPRGCPSYVKNYVDVYVKNNETAGKRRHKPHPNIIDELKGGINPESIKLGSNHSPRLQVKRDDAAKYSDYSDDDGLDDDVTRFQIDSEYSIPDDAEKLLATS